MPETKCFKQVRGRVIRVTRVDACGVPLVGQSAVAVSKNISSVAIEPVTEDGTNIRDRNFGDEMTTVDDSYTELIGYTGEINLMGVDPDMVSIFAQVPVVKNAAGDTVGFDSVTGIDLDQQGYALEVWSRLAGNQCASDGSRMWGYTVFPFFKGGMLGGFTFENAAVNFTITGAQTRDGNGWGAGPFDVELSGGTAPNFTAGPLFTPLPTNAHYRNIITAVQPPAASCGAFALAP